MKKPPRPKDTNQLAKFIVDLVTGQMEPQHTADGKNAAAVALGRRGGLKGGKARAKALTAEKRQEIAKKAAKSRWRQSQEKEAQE